MEKKEHLDYLKEKYEELKEKYLHELIYGKSLAQIKDISEVLECIRLEIETIENDPGIVSLSTANEY